MLESVFPWLAIVVVALLIGAAYRARAGRGSACSPQHWRGASTVLPAALPVPAAPARPTDFTIVSENLEAGNVDADGHGHVVVRATSPT